MARTIQIRRGLNVPVVGEPRQTIEQGPQVTRVGLVADDYEGLKPTMAVRDGDRVKLGQVLFTDKQHPDIQYTAPAAGTVVAINRGAKRRFESLVIEQDGDDQIALPNFRDHNLSQLPRSDVRDQLLASGLWTALRARPYSKVPDPQTVPHALFITAIDTNPLAANPAIVLERWPSEFEAGLQVLSTVPEQSTYLCKAAGANIPGQNLPKVEVVEFAGPHPAGLPGTHMHFLSPVHAGRTCWYLNYQDVVAIGHLFLTGQIMTERVVSIAGPAAMNSRLVRTQLGANLLELTDGEIKPDLPYGARIVSGSVLSGRQAVASIAFLGRYSLQISLLPEGKQRELLGWATPGQNKFSIKPAFLSNWISDSSRRYPFTTSTEGSLRAIVPIGSYERVMPLDIIPTPLLKSLIVGDTETAQTLGCLELDEEDLGLCTFVCPGKNDYGPLLRESLRRIELEG